MIIIDVKNDTSEYIKDIFELAQKHNKLSNVICLPMCSLEDFKNVKPNIGQKILKIFLIII